MTIASFQYLFYSFTLFFEFVFFCIGNPWIPFFLVTVTCSFLQEISSTRVKRVQKEELTAKESSERARTGGKAGIYIGVGVLVCCSKITHASTFVFAKGRRRLISRSTCLLVVGS